MKSLFQDVKSRLTIQDLCSRQHIDLIPCGDERYKALCPFHQEKTPSFTVYGETGSYFCFGCQATGDVISLAAHFYGCRPFESVIRLNHEFGLGLSFGESPAAGNRKSRPPQN